LSEAPGHMFNASDVSELQMFLALIVEQGWNAELLTAASGTASRRLFVSHDGWVQRA
jgi:hypothetical protein